MRRVIVSKYGTEERGWNQVESLGPKFLGCSQNDIGFGKVSEDKVHLWMICG